MKEKSADDVERADDHQAKHELGNPVRLQEPETRKPGHNFMQIASAVENYCVVVPSLSRPEPDPTRSANESADDDQEDPHQESPVEHVHRKAALAQRVVTVAQRI